MHEEGSFLSGITRKLTEHLPLYSVGSDDEAISPENSVLYYLALLKNKVSASLHIYPKGGHSFGFRTALSLSICGLRKLRNG